MQLNNLKGAIKDFNTVLTLNPNNPEAYYLRGMVKFESEDDKGACEDWQKVAISDKRAAKMLKKHCK
jgi:cytochrome c-type biogenesis protein CcmH/NrfG